MGATESSVGVKQSSSRRWGCTRACVASWASEQSLGDSNLWTAASPKRSLCSAGCSCDLGLGWARRITHSGNWDAGKKGEKERKIERPSLRAPPSTARHASPSKMPSDARESTLSHRKLLPSQGPRDNLFQAKNIQWHGNREYNLTR